MAVVDAKQLTERIRKMFSENPTDEEISLLEDFTDTYASLSANDTEGLRSKLDEAEKKNSEWEQKYKEMDNGWRKKYTDRFEGRMEDIPEIKQSLEADRGANISIEDLFTPKN